MEEGGGGRDPNWKIPIRFFFFEAFPKEPMQKRSLFLEKNKENNLLISKASLATTKFLAGAVAKADQQLISNSLCK